MVACTAGHITIVEKAACVSVVHVVVHVSGASTSSNRRTTNALCKVWFTRDYRYRPWCRILLVRSVRHSSRALEIIIGNVKRGLKKVTSGTMNTRLEKVLFTYRLTPHSTTAISPAELLLGRRPRTCLDLLHPNTAGRVEEKRKDTMQGDKTFQKGEAVLVKNYGAGCKWLPGKILDTLGPVSFHVLLEDGRRRRHQDQM